MLLCVSDALAAYLFDACVVLFGLIIENALAERVQVGVKPNVEYKPKYSLAQLLDPSFRLPQPVQPKQTNGLSALLAMAGRKGSGVRLWQGKTH